MSTDDTVTVDNRDPETIRKEINEATANLTDTLDELHERFQPDVLVAEAKEKALTVRDRILDGSRRHPLATALVGIGALWLVGRSFIGGGGKAQVGGGVVSFALGAVVGIGVYRAVIAEQHWDDDDLDGMTGEVEHDVNLPATHPSHVALE